MIYTQTILILQAGHKKVLEQSCWRMNVDFLAEQLTFHSHLPNGQGRGESFTLYRASKIWELLVQRTSWISTFFKPCTALSTAYLCFYKFFKWYFILDFFFLIFFQHKARWKCMPVDTFWAIRATPEPAIKSLFNSFQKEFTNLK